ncbi:MAG: hypothetical protein ABEJ67_03250 [Halanaeroarchaeum sp.]
MGRRANPAFAWAVVLLPVVALAYVLWDGTVQQHTLVHVMAGVLWTGIDVFMGLIVGPVVGGLEEEHAAAFFERFTPKSAFFLPVIAIVAIVGGITLAIRMGLLPSPDAWLALFTLVNLPGPLLLLGWQFDAWRDPRWAVPFGLATAGSLYWVGTTIGSLAMPGPSILAALAIVTVLNLEGFGLLLPGEVRIYLEMTSEHPDSGVISAIGQRNAMLAGVQGALQIAIVGVMVYLRYGGFPMF